MEWPTDFRDGSGNEEVFKKNLMVSRLASVATLRNPRKQIPLEYYA